MQFPDLETIVIYGIYSIRELMLYSQNKLKKRKIRTLNECEDCCFVYYGSVCNNCNCIKNNSLV